VVWLQMAESISRVHFSKLSNLHRGNDFKYLVSNNMTRIHRITFCVCVCVCARSGMGSGESTVGTVSESSNFLGSFSYLDREYIPRGD
jgi:hypothetical protein